MKPLICFALSGFLLTLTGAAPSIGLVRSGGDFRVGGSIIRGNGTVFEGDLIETNTTRSVVQLSEVQLTLLPGSRAKVYRDRTILEKGSTLVRDSEKHAVEVETLQITSTAKGGLVQIDLTGPNSVSVFARSGAAQVRNAAGVLVASLRPGMALAFTPQAAAANSVKLTGVVAAKNGKFLLTDKTTNTTVELRGVDLAKYAGKQVTVTGSSIAGATPVAGASQVVQVASISQERGGAAAAGGAAAGGAAAGGAAAGGAAAGGAAAGAAAGAAGAAAGAAAGISAATIAVVGGVAAAATVGGLAASGSLPGQSDTSTP